GALDEVAPERAHHFELGGDWSRAGRYLRRAAELAARRYEVAGARASLQHALTLAGNLPLAERGLVETEILDALADTYLGTFDPRAVEPLTLLRERAARSGRVDIELKALVDLAYPLAWSDSGRALEVIGQALRLSEAHDDPLIRARTRARCMMRRIWTRGWDAADAAECRRALRDVGRMSTPQDAAWHVIDCNLLDFFSARYRTAMRDVLASLATLGTECATGHLSYAQSVRELTVPWCLTLLGEWGEALDRLDTGIDLAEKNGDTYSAETLLLSRCSTLLHAMDFAGARAICDSVLPAFDHPARAPWRRWCLAMSGAAEAGVGNHERAIERLRTAGEEMDRHPALGDWYWRLWQQCALANLWLSRGDLARARDAGELFLANAAATEERTWQALAGETQARIALASDELPLAQSHVTNALAAIEGVEAPVAAWQAHAAAAEVFRKRGATAAAAHHRATSRDIILRLATALGAERETLRRTFVSAGRVAGILEPAVHVPGVVGETIR
ncbi:MAG TPA: hypothetical protein VHM30_04340, partial [Gemmatimonadaceae bacterium]|nr:hypothetical protein [Gemmatimonadaceae bacterium]